MQDALETPLIFISHAIDDFLHLISDIVGIKDFHEVAIPADFLIEVISGVKLV